MKPPTPSTPQQSRDIFGAEFNGTPSHHRVLKPPGGGSSDIFGTATSQDTNMRRVKNHMASNVFLSDEPSTNGTSVQNNHQYHHHQQTPAKQSGNDSFCRLFGPPSPPKSVFKPNAQLKLQSNILPTNNDTAETVETSTKAETATTTTTSATQEVANDGHHDQNNGNTEYANGDNTDGSTGGHDEPIMNGNANPVMNGNRTNGNANQTGPTSTPRARVPPGGFSSGLW